MAWKEQYFYNRGASVSSKGLGDTRVFTNDGFSVESTIGQSASEGVAFGAEHPRYSGLVVSNASYVPQGGGTLITVQYVPREYQDPIPPEDVTEDEYTTIDTTFEDVDVDIPVFQQVTKSFGEAGSLVEKTVYEVVETTATFRYSRIVHRVQLNATVIGGAGVTTQLAITQALNAQTNKIHTINGVRYLFKADDVRRLAVDKYRFTYRWINDPGVPDTLVYEASTGRNLGWIGGYLFPHEDQGEDDERFIIKPFNRLDWGPGPNPEDPPVIQFSPSYPENPTGHLSLPGVS